MSPPRAPGSIRARRTARLTACALGLALAAGCSAPGEHAAPRAHAASEPAAPGDTAPSERAATGDTAPSERGATGGTAASERTVVDAVLQPLFNGRDLSGWVPVNGGPGTWRVEDGLIVCTGHPTGVLRSPKAYENFVLELDWRHLTPGGNAGLFVWSDPLPARGQPFTRAIEVQIMDGVETADYTSQGDVFSIQGARMTPDRPHPSGWERCLPSARVSKPAPEWNHYRVIGRDGAVSLEVNGVLVSSGHDCTPRQGYVCLEAEGSDVQFRNVRLAELPSCAQPLAPEFIVETAQAFRSLLDGGGLAGWHGEDAAAHWSANDWTLASDGHGGALRTDETRGDLELVVDWRWTGAVPDPRAPIALHGVVSPQLTDIVPSGAWQRVRLTLRGQLMTLEHNGKELMRDALQKDLPPTGPLALLDFGQPVEFGNLYIRSL